MLTDPEDTDALARCQELTRRQAGHSAHWVNLGTILRGLRRYEEALAAYIRAAALGEDSPSFLYNVGLLHQDRGDYESARRVLADAARQAPGDTEILIQYAQCCYDSLHIEATDSPANSLPPSRCCC
jgi:Flp pilus assembly protein TadD